MKIAHPRINLKFLEGLPSENFSDEFADKKPRILIIDDLMSEICNSDKLSNLFTRGSHHLNISIFFLTQNLFLKSKCSRTLNLNSHYLIIFKNPRDATSIRHIAQQVFPSNSRFLQSAYENAISEPYGYILLDFKTQDDNLRVRTQILPNEPQFVYTPTKKYK